MLIRATALLLAFSVAADGFKLGAHNRANIQRSSLKLHAKKDDFTIAIVGDLHFDPRFMDDHLVGREQIKKIIDTEKMLGNNNVVVVSLGDLGESKAVTEGSTELFAGTSPCFALAREWFDGFEAPFEVIGGNHDLEGIDEFPTDESNLEAYMAALGKKTAQFSRVFEKEKAVMIGLGSTVFRESRYTSHEVYIDGKQIDWFEAEVAKFPAEEGWKIFVFSHAPPMGSGLRVLQENHVVNGCCWLNHSDEKTASRFINIVRKNLSVKAWFSAHFHLGQDYEDSMTLPEGKNRGDCIFCQTSVMSSKSTRDGRRQSRLIRGGNGGFSISSINHAKDGDERLDVTITCSADECGIGILAHPSVDYDHDSFFSAYSPEADDGCYISFNEDGSMSGEVCWWHMSCGRVLGKQDGMLLEYDADTLAPLGMVVGREQLRGRSVQIVDSGIEKHEPGSVLYRNREQAIVLYSDTDKADVTVIHPNEDGSYWRKIVRNKVIRMKEKRREKAAQKLVREIFSLPADEKPQVESCWGPYISTEGNAMKVKKA